MPANGHRYKVAGGVGVYCENFVMIGLTADAGDHFKNRASIPLAPCILNELLTVGLEVHFTSYIYIGVRTNMQNLFVVQYAFAEPVL